MSCLKSLGCHCAFSETPPKGRNGSGTVLQGRTAIFWGADLGQGKVNVKRSESHKLMALRTGLGLIRIGYGTASVGSSHRLEQALMRAEEAADPGTSRCLIGDLNRRRGYGDVLWQGLSLASMRRPTTTASTTPTRAVMKELPIEQMGCEFVPRVPYHAMSLFEVHVMTKATKATRLKRTAVYEPVIRCMPLEDDIKDMQNEVSRTQPKTIAANDSSNLMET